MQGASAFQKLLDEQQDPRIKVFVIWEPVLPTDFGSPSTRTLARIFDRRATQYWDKGRLVSKSLGEKDDDSIVWDMTAVYRPGNIWDNAPPEPVYSSVPVRDVMDEAKEAIQKVLQENTR